MYHKVYYVLYFNIATNGRQSGSSLLRSEVLYKVKSYTNQ